MFVEAFRHESYSFALSTAPQLAMAQEQLRDVWLHAQHGRLCAWEQAKALALREASRELKPQAKRTEPSRNRSGAIGSRGRIAKYDFLAADKL